MSSFELHDCQIDCHFHWRPNFSDVEPRLRVQFFDGRIVVTGFEDASEGITRGITLFSGDASTCWRVVLEALLSDAEFVTFNEDWPNVQTLVSPGELRYDRQPSLAMRILAISWLGSQWSEIARQLSLLNDADLRRIGEAQSFEKLIVDVSDEIEAVCVELDGDIDVGDLIRDMLIGVTRGSQPSEVSNDYISNLSSERDY